MYLIGLTGGIAAGKSFVAAELTARGAVHIDADVLAREAVQTGSAGLAAVVAAFGAQVLLPDGALDRAALGTIIFADTAQRETLNAIVHPLVWQRTQQLIEAAQAHDAQGIVVYDVPLLAEAAADRPLTFDLIVVVVADTETRISRMVEHRGMSRADALQRIASQATDADRLALADVIIDNSGDPSATLRQVDELWRGLQDRRAKA